MKQNTRGGVMPHTSEDAAVEEYIRMAADEDALLPLLQADNRPGVRYHLSPMRRAVLSWYPFNPAASLLEWQGQAGALTGLFCNRCAKVTSVEKNDRLRALLAYRWRSCPNLSVMEQLPPEQPLFDYIAAVEPENLDETVLQSMRRRLAPGGRLLLVIPNRFGMQNWFGCTPPGGLLPYEGILAKGGGRSRPALEAMLAAAGFGQPQCRWFYPLRDHRYTQEIYTDSWLPSPRGNSRYYPFCEGELTALAGEEELLPQLLEEEVFPFFSNGFVVECRTDENTQPCPVEYASITEGRPPAGRFATVIMPGKVQKIALHPSGVAHLHQMEEHSIALKSKSIETVASRLQGPVLEMPRMHGETLWNSWNTPTGAQRFDDDAFLALVDRVAGCIRRASPADPPGSHGWDVAFGPVQHRAYLELVPANCFYQPDTDELIFFDQEFTRENCPTSLPLYRAIANACNTKGGYPWLEHLKDRYGLTKIWHKLEEEDTRFMADIFGTTRQRLHQRWQQGGRVAANRLMLAAGRVAACAQRRGWQRVALYGYGSYGRAFARWLPPNGVQVAYALDKNAGVMGNNGHLPVYKPDKLPDEPVDGILVALAREGETVAEQLRRRFPLPVETLKTI